MQEEHEAEIQRLQAKIINLESALARAKLAKEEALEAVATSQVRDQAMRASAWQEGWDAGVQAGIGWVTTKDTHLDKVVPPIEAGLALNPHVDGLLQQAVTLRRQVDDAWDEVRKGNLPVDQIPAARAWVALAHEAMSFTGFVGNNEPVSEPDSREAAVRLTEQEVRDIHKAFRAYMGRDRTLNSDELVDGLAKYTGVNRDEALESAQKDIHWIVAKLLEHAVAKGSIQPDEVGRLAFTYVSMLRMLAQTFWAASKAEGSTAPNYLLTTFVDPEVQDEVIEVVLRRVHGGQLPFVRMHRACVAMFLSERPIVGGV